MYEAKHKHKHSHIRKCHIIIIAIIVLFAMIGGVFAKYIYNNGGMNLLSAKEFYFTSNLLSEGTSNYVVNSTATDISFTLGNNADKLRVSQDDIQYTVSVECKEGLASGEPAPVLSANNGVLEAGGVTTDTITLSNLVRGKTYIVTATGTAGYRQTLKAEFFVSDNGENVYKHLDNSNGAYVLLTVWTENVAGTLGVEFNENGLIPDNTDSVLRGIHNYTEGVYGAIDFDDQSSFITKYSSHIYRFFTDGATSITVDQFEVILDDTYIAKADTPK